MFQYQNNTMYINCIFLEYYQTVISNMLVCIPFVMLNDNYMHRSMANKKTSRISTTCQLVEKVYFYKNRANSLSLLERFVGFASLQSLWAFYLGILAETPNPFPMGRGYITGATAPDQARMLAVSRTKPLHDAVAQMADDLYGGYAPATPFFINYRGFSTD